MKLVFPISVEQFEKYKKFVKDNIQTDFYTGSKQRNFIISLNSHKKQTVKFYNKILTKIAPYNLHARLLPNDKLKLIRGFLLDKNKKIYSYATSSINTVGVYMENDKPYVFYIGDASQAIRLPFIHQLVADKVKPVVFERDNPDEKCRWYSIGLIPQMTNMEKAIAYFKTKDLSDTLLANEQVVWDYWLSHPEFLPQVIAKK